MSVSVDRDDPGMECDPGIVRDRFVERGVGRNPGGRENCLEELMRGGRFDPLNYRAGWLGRLVCPYSPGSLCLCRGY